LAKDELIDVFGTDEPVAEEQALAAGRLSVRIADGQIKSVVWDGTEIARGITYFLRDADWATPLATSMIGPIRGNGESCGTEIVGEIDSGPIRFKYTVSIDADASGRLRISTEGTALSSFQSNRVGLTFLHPVPHCCGRALTVTHSDGSEEATSFPLPISPSQPVFDIAALSYELSDRQTVETTFRSVRPDGSVQYFEMEDQRNWGDASYKTYVGSLLDPWPFDVKAGDTFVQEIVIAVKAAGTRAAAAASGKPEPREAGVGGFKVPEIGVSVPLDGAAGALENIRRHGCFRPAYVSAYLRSDSMNPGELEALCSVAKTLDCRLEVELEVHGEPDEALASAAERISKAGLDVHSILACPAPYLKSYQPDAVWPDVMPLDAFYGLVRRHFPASRVGGGMLTYFTELNRKWPPAGAMDYVGHAYCPIIHAADDETVLQNIDSLPFIAETVAQRLPGTAYEIVSATLSMRHNPYGAAPQPNPLGRRMAMAITDPREKGQFGGLWMLEVAEAVAETHVEAITLGALSGHSSIYCADRPEGRLPAYYAMEALAGMVGADVEAFRKAKETLVERRFKGAQMAFLAIRGRPQDD
jgi:hypothetical protein